MIRYKIFVDGYTTINPYSVFQYAHNTYSLLKLLQPLQKTGNCGSYFLMSRFSTLGIFPDKLV